MTIGVKNSVNHGVIRHSYKHKTANVQKKAAMGASRAPTTYQPPFATGADRSTGFHPPGLENVAGQPYHLKVPTGTSASHCGQ